MGLVRGYVWFPGRPPSLEALAGRITERSGLAVRVESLDLFDGDYLLHGRLSFACDPRLSVEVSCKEPETQRRRLGEDYCRGREEAVACGLASPEILEAPLPPLPSGFEVRVKTYVGVEPTLYFQALLALEDLGGAPCEMDKPPSEQARREYDEARREYGGPVTRAELRRRRHEAERMVSIAVLVQLLLLPVTLPLLAVRVLWEVLWAFPKRYRALQERWQRGEFSVPRRRQDSAPQGTALPPGPQQPPSQGSS